MGYPKKARKSVRKCGRPKQQGRGVGIMVRAHDELIRKLDAWRTAQPVPPSRPAALKYLAERQLDAEPSGMARMAVHIRVAQTRRRQNALKHVRRSQRH